jgi:hypothetical protein
MNKGLLFRYLIIYPFYYVIAMLFAVALLTLLMDWSFVFAKKIFFIFAGIMWFVCYFAHFDIFRYAISGDSQSRHK